MTKLSERPDYEQSVVFTMEPTPMPLPDVMEPLTDVICNLQTLNEDRILLTNVYASKPEKLYSSPLKEMKVEPADLNNNVDIFNDNIFHKLFSGNSRRSCVKEDDTFSISTSNINLIATKTNELVHKKRPRLKYTEYKNPNLSVPPLVPADMLWLEEHSLDSFTPKMIKQEVFDLLDNVEVKREDSVDVDDDESELSEKRSCSINILKDPKIEDKSSITDDAFIEDKIKCEFQNKMTVLTERVDGSVNAPKIEYIDLISSDDEEEPSSHDLINKSEFTREKNTKSRSEKTRYKIHPKIVAQLKSQKHYEQLKKMTYRRRRHIPQGDGIGYRINTVSKRKTRVNKNFVDSDVSCCEMVSSGTEFEEEQLEARSLSGNALEREIKTKVIERMKSVSSPKRKRRIVNIDDFLDDGGLSDKSKENAFVWNCTCDTNRSRDCNMCTAPKKMKSKQHRNKRILKSSAEIEKISMNERFKQRLKAWKKERKRSERKQKRSQSISKHQETEYDSFQSHRKSSQVQSSKCFDVKRSKNFIATSSDMTFSIQCFKLGTKSCDSSSSISVKVRNVNSKACNRRVSTQEIKEKEELIHNENSNNDTTDSVLTSSISEESFKMADKRRQHRVSISSNKTVSISNKKSPKKASGSFRKRTSTGDSVNKAKVWGSFALEKKKNSLCV